MYIETFVCNPGSHSHQETNVQPYRCHGPYPLLFNFPKRKEEAKGLGALLDNMEDNG